MALPILNSEFKINDLQLNKNLAASKICQAIDFAEKQNSDPIKKFASKDSLIQLFSQMLEQLNLKSEGDPQELVQKLATKVDKTASIKKGDRETNIKIVSKSLKDSHYQVDVSKDLITHKGRRVFMVSCYARDSYLGRYLIKRNYFYTTDREASANDAYDEIVNKMSALKDRYYNEILDVSGIFSQAKQILDGVISEVEIESKT
jgi:hypothetical protein